MKKIQQQAYSSRQTPGRVMRILLAEDNVRLRAIISQAFTGNDFAVDTAECAADAQAAIQAIAIWR